MPKIKRLDAREILDSRGTPTVLAEVELVGGIVAEASVPSGRSTGIGEAVALRDGDARRYRGQGVRKAVANVRGPIADAVSGGTFEDQAELDRAMVQLDGTANKSSLGANAILAVSVAFARACALEKGEPLYAHFARMLGVTPGAIPRLTINLFSGGKHAGGQVAIQDALVVPASSTSVDESLVMMYDIYHAGVDLMHQRWQARWLTADEGGLAPPFRSTDEMLDAACQCIGDAGYSVGSDVMLAMDLASSHFYSDGRYHVDGRELDANAMIDQLVRWADRYPVVSMEDGLAEEDWDHWPRLMRELGDRLLVLGDDLLCTDPRHIRRAIKTQACNALLLKVNQVGTLTEAAEAYRLAKQAGWMVTVSVRSGETEDDWAADLAVGWCGDQFKNGSITQSERLAKYNRLLAIEAATGWRHVGWPGGS